MDPGELFAEAPMLALAVIVGYVLGALPLADQISRRRGVDIFSVGTGLAGSSNVRRSIGPVPGGIVLLGDLGKGVLVVLMAGILGVEGPWVLLPAFATILGHWRSVFSRFRGGDSLAVLGGLIIGMFPVLGIISACVAFAVSYGAQRLPYTSLLSIVFGYLTLATLSVAYGEDTAQVVGAGGLTGLVLAHALLGHRRRRNAAAWEDVEDAEGTAEDSGI